MITWLISVTKSEHAVFDDRRRDRRERDNVIIKHRIRLAIMLGFIDVERGERISEHPVEPLCTSMLRPCLNLGHKVLDVTSDILWSVTWGVWILIKK